MGRSVWSAPADEPTPAAAADQGTAPPRTRGPLSGTLRIAADGFTGDCEAIVRFQRRVLDGILSGEISLAFRKWIRPTVRAGGTLRTPAGALSIRSVTRIGESEITEEDARAAGHASRAELLRELASGRPGWLYRIEVRPASSPDPPSAPRGRRG